MLQRRVIRAATVVTALALVPASACAPPPAHSTAPVFDGLDAEELRATERARLRSLVAADTAAARRLHADDFQVVNPAGRAFSREQYLRDVAAGVIDYLAWEADSIAVRIYGGVAALRYQSRVEMTVRGEPRRMHAWNTVLYERRAGRWQVVWVQITEAP